MAGSSHDSAFVGMTAKLKERGERNEGELRQTAYILKNVLTRNLKMQQKIEYSVCNLGINGVASSGLLKMMQCALSSE